MHVGRFSGMPWADRVCKHCIDWAGRFGGCIHKTENEEHLVMRCDKRSNERADMYGELGWEKTGQERASSDDVVFAWLVGEGPQGENAGSKTVRCTAVMRFLRRVWSKRVNDSECWWAGQE